MREKNKGYSLIEMIIVLAIIAVVSVMSLLSVGIIRTARAKDAANTFNSEVSELITQSKNMTFTFNGTSYTSYQYALRIYKDSNGDFFLQKCYYDTDADKYEDSIGGVKVESRNSGKGIGLTSYVTVKYQPDNGANSNQENDFTELYIRYNKDGTMAVDSVNSAVSGAATSTPLYAGDGTYVFYKRNGNSVARVTLRTNGSHQSK